MKIKWNIKNNYIKLPKELYEKQLPTPVKNPKIVLLNNKLASKLGLNKENLNSKIGTEYLSGNTIPENSIPIAQSYAGHQFGHFTILGDGRAILIGEQVIDNKTYEIQLKGSGVTPFSRNGDGRATLTSMLREYIISEAMYSLNIPTTRSLAVVSTGENVYREKINQGGILTRISESYIRVGTFQYAATKGKNIVKELADYTIKHYYPECVNEDNIYLSLLNKVIYKQGQLIAKWQSVGFIHGVMNTDNVSIIGETIDYGPCAFMDNYKSNTVFSSIDHHGRYSYINQPIIIQWNLARFAETLLELIDSDQKKSIRLAENALLTFTDIFESYYFSIMRKKIGIFKKSHLDKDLINELLIILETNELDYTNTFVNLTNPDFKSNINNFNMWLTKWKNRLNIQTESFNDSILLMKKNNPFIIPRNHQVENVLKTVIENNDFTPLKLLIEALSNPFDYTINQKKYTIPPEPTNIPYRTFCGT